MEVFGMLVGVGILATILSTRIKPREGPRGNYYCTKCGVPADYYNDYNIDRPSCRVEKMYK